MSRGHREGDGDGMLLVLMLDEDTKRDRAKSDNAEYILIKDRLKTLACQAETAI